MAQSTFTVSEGLVTELQRHIAAQPKGTVPGDVEQAFCSTWAEARIGLQGLGTVLSLVPAIGMFAGAAISIVLAAGDAAKGALCKD
jgi:hypothetical protein